jgi:iron complex transport system ATP-binding protein
MSGLVVRGLTVRVMDRLLLDEVSLEVGTGELVALIGPNGAGKTTCLKAILGLVPAQGERIELDGRALSELTLRERARALAYLPQARHVAWPLSVASTVLLGRHPHAREGETVERARIARTLETVGLEGFAERDVRTLSGGELALVLLARALLVEAPILLADEPVASLDLAHQLAVMGELRRAACAGAGVLVVMHDLSLAARCCDRLLLLDRGRLVAAGPPDAVLADPATQEAYGVDLVRGEIAGVPVVVARAGISAARVA